MSDCAFEQGDKVEWANRGAIPARDKRSYQGTVRRIEKRRDNGEFEVWVDWDVKPSGKDGEEIPQTAGVHPRSLQPLAKS